MVVARSAMRLSLIVLAVRMSAPTNAVRAQVSLTPKLPPVTQSPPPIDLSKVKQTPMSLQLACTNLAKRCLPDNDANACGFYLKACTAVTSSNGNPLLLKVSACSVIEDKCRAGTPQAAATGFRPANSCAAGVALVLV